MSWQDIIRFGFRLLYYELAWTYDVVSWVVSLGAWRDWQRAALPFLHGKRILEIAHGPGHMLVELFAQRKRVMGLDLSFYMSHQAQRTLARHGAEVPLLLGRVQDLPLPAESFDSVLSTFPTEFIMERETLTAVYRLLKPNGRFVIVPEGHLTGASWLHRFIDWLFVITGQREGLFETDVAAFWEPWRQHFVAAGFQTEIHQIGLQGSVATVIVAMKPSS
ncbi:MAG: methyltransferase domain-containing protein [Chloroflexota bacterium]